MTDVLDYLALGFVSGIVFMLAILMVVSDNERDGEGLI